MCRVGTCLPTFFLDLYWNETFAFPLFTASTIISCLVLHWPPHPGDEFSGNYNELADNYRVSIHQRIDQLDWQRNSLLASSSSWLPRLVITIFPFSVSHAFLKRVQHKSPFKFSQIRRGCTANLRNTIQFPMEYFRRGNLVVSGTWKNYV